MWGSEEYQTLSGIPEIFLRRVEADLNKTAQWIPDYLTANYDEIKKYWNYPNALEFLVGWIAGNCHGSYLQAYIEIYKEPPTLEVQSDIRKIISRRRNQIEQGVNAFLEENIIK